MFDAAIKMCTDDGSNSEKEDEDKANASEEEPCIHFTSFVSDARDIVAMGMPAKASELIIDAAMIDTGLSVLSSVGADHKIALMAASVRKALFSKSTRTIRELVVWLNPL